MDRHPSPRLRQPQRKVLDTLVESGVARSRSDAVARCVKLVKQHSESGSPTYARPWRVSAAFESRARTELASRIAGHATAERGICGPASACAVQTAVLTPLWPAGNLGHCA